MLWSFIYDNEQVERVSYLEACGRSGTSSESQMNSATCIKLSSKIARAQGHGSLEVEVNDELNGSFKVLVKDELNAKTDYPPDQNDDIDITTQTDQVAIKVICHWVKGGISFLLACFNFKISTHIFNIQFSFYCRVRFFFFFFFFIRDNFIDEWNLQQRCIIHDVYKRPSQFARREV